MTIPDDEALRPLIDRMAEGDKQALRAFIESTGPAIHAAQLRLTGTTVAAAVLVEETLAELWETAPLYDRDQGRPWVWVMAVTRAIGLRYVERRKGKERRLKSRPDAEALLSDGDSGMDARAADALAEMHAGASAALKRAWYQGVPGGTQGEGDAKTVAEALPELVRRLGDDP